MEAIIEFFKGLHSVENLRQIIQTGGLLIVVGIVFAETGLLAGFFLPGDSLLVTAGIFTASDGFGGPPLFNLYIALLLVTLAAVIGDQVGYLLGKKAGPVIFNRPDSRFFKKKHLIAAQDFYTQHGGKAIIIARFSPFLRTFVPFAAGVAQMDYKGFVKYNVVGGVLWVFSMILLGHFLGLSPLANQLHKIIVVVVALSLLPVVYSVYKAWRGKGTAKAAPEKEASL